MLKNNIQPVILQRGNNIRWAIKAVGWVRSDWVQLSQISKTHDWRLSPKKDRTLFKEKVFAQYVRRAVQLAYPFNSVKLVRVKE